MNSNLKEVAQVFFKLGCFAFGGPAAHIAMMQDEIVQKRKWMSEEKFLDLMGATNLIPGPNSTEMTMHCGHERAGWQGLFVAGIAFIFPAVFITGILAWAYTTYGQLPEVEPFIYGIKPIVIALIAGAILKLGKKALKGIELGVLGGLVVIATLFGINEIMALLGAGILGGFYFSMKEKSTNTTNSIAPFFLAKVVTGGLVKSKTLAVFLSFLKVGAVLYGSGYVLFPYLESELVARGWMTIEELMDAIAVGQFTPGPVLSTATFVGWQLHGLWGSIAASTGIFLPSFLFVLALNPLIPKMRKSKVLKHFLNSVNIAAVAIMVAVLFEMSREMITDWQTIVIALVGVGLTFGVKKMNAMVLVLIGSGLGFILSLI